MVKGNINREKDGGGERREGMGIEEKSRKVNRGEEDERKDKERESFEGEKKIKRVENEIKEKERKEE